MLLSALAACFLAGVPAMGEDKLYKWVDEDGNVTYQDQPPPDGSGQLETLSDDVGGSEPSAAMPDVDVVLYSIEACDACDLVRKVLEDRGVPFEEKDAEDNVEVQNEIREISGTLSVPVLLIGDDVQTGYNRRRIVTGLEEAGFTGQTAGDGQPAQSRQATGEESQQREQAADDNEGLLLEEDIFSDSAPGDGGDTVEFEEIPEDERIQISQ